jgi:hypothetical protein
MGRWCKLALPVESREGGVSPMTTMDSVVDSRRMLLGCGRYIGIWGDLVVLLLHATEYEKEFRKWCTGTMYACLLSSDGEMRFWIWNHWISNSWIFDITKILKIHQLDNLVYTSTRNPYLTSPDIIRYLVFVSRFFRVYGHLLYSRGQGELDPVASNWLTNRTFLTL